MYICLRCLVYISFIIIIIIFFLGGGGGEGRGLLQVLACCIRHQLPGSLPVFFLGPWH